MQNYTNLVSPESAKEQGSVEDKVLIILQVPLEGLAFPAFQCDLHISNTGSNVSLTPIACIQYICTTRSSIVARVMPFYAEDTSS